MGYLRETIKNTLTSRFQKELDERVEIIVFRGDNCEYCKVTEEMLRELSKLHSLINFESYDNNDKIAKKYNIQYVPTVIITDGEKYGNRIRYIGAPMGYEFTSLVEDIIDVSRRTAEVDDETKEKLNIIDKPIKIEVFVTPTCPYCPSAVRTAHKFAILNENITGEMIEAIEFPEWTNKWNVMSVPHIVINEKVQFIGAYPDEQFIKYVMEAYKKEE